MQDAAAERLAAGAAGAALGQSDFAAAQSLDGEAATGARIGADGLGTREMLVERSLQLLASATVLHGQPRAGGLDEDTRLRLVQSRRKRELSQALDALKAAFEVGEVEARARLHDARQWVERAVYEHWTVQEAAAAVGALGPDLAGPAVRFWARERENLHAAAQRGAQLATPVLDATSWEVRVCTDAGQVREPLVELELSAFPPLGGARETTKIELSKAELASLLVDLDEADEMLGRLACAGR